MISRDFKPKYNLEEITALTSNRDLEEAEKHFRETIRSTPSFAKSHEKLGYVLFKLRRFAEAERVLRTAVDLDPQLELAYFILANALAEVGRGVEADLVFERYLALQPQRKILAQAAKLHQEGRLEEAERVYCGVLRDAPDNVDALRLLGIMAAGQNRVAQAEKLLRKSVSLAPDFIGAQLDFGQLLMEQERYQEAIGCFKKAIEIDAVNIKAHYSLAGALSHCSLSYDAVEAYKKVLEIKPDHFGAMLGLAHMQKTVGDTKDAIELYRKCIEFRPDKGEIYWSLANLKTYRFSDMDIADMEARVTGKEITQSSKVNFLFALAKSHEDKGDVDWAWRYYRDGNDLRRMNEQYDPVNTEVQNDAIIKIFSGEFLRAHKGRGHQDRSPILIVGLPRSGSTLTEQILASHPQVEGTGELSYLGKVVRSLNLNRADGIHFPEVMYQLDEKQIAQLGQDYLDYCQIHRVQNKPFFIDKMPNNFPLIGFLQLILPNAKVIDVRRHPLDACLSCYRQLFSKGQAFTYDLTDIGEYYLEYQRMMDYWHQVLPGRVLTVQYEETVTDFENQVKRILEFCELPWDERCLRFYETVRPVRTASSEQVRQPIYGGSINRFKQYLPYLEELTEILAPILPRYEHLCTLADG